MKKIYIYLLSLTFTPLVLFAQEPSNHPTGFTATTTSSTSITLSWTGSASGTLPTNYLIVAKKNVGGTYPSVADATPVADDNDFTDVNLNGAINVAHVVGANSYNWLSLDPATLYDFRIYPYTGSGAAIDFKTGGGPPTSSTTTFANEPANHVVSFAAAAFSPTSIQLTWTGSIGSPLPSNYLIVARKTGGTFASIADGTAVADDNNFTGGTANGAINVVHSVGANSYTWTSLDPGSTYEFEIYPYNGSGSTINFKTDVIVPNSSASLPDEPLNYPTVFSASAISPTSIQVTWTGSTGSPLPSNYVLLARKSGGTYASVADGTSVADDNDFSDVNTNGAINLIHSVGANSYTWTGLDPGTTYQFIIHPYNGSGSIVNFKTGAPPNTSASLPSEPTNHVTGFAAVAAGASTINLSWTGSITSPLPSNYLIVARKSGGTFAAVADGTPVVDDNDFTDVNTNGAINVVHAVGVNNYAWNSLDPNTTYQFEIYPYNGSGVTINYKTAATVPSASATTLAAEPANHVTGFTAATSGSNSIQLSWTGSTGSPLPSNYLIVARKLGGTYPAVADGTAVADDNDFTDVNTNGAINVVHVVGANSYNWLSLDPGTGYDFKIYPYIGSGSGTNFKIGGEPSASAFTYSLEPSAHPAFFDAVSTTTTNIRLSFPAASSITNAGGYIILRRTDSTDPTATGVNDGTQPSLLPLTGGTTRITTIASTVTTFFDDATVTVGNRYNYAIIPYNSNGVNNETYNYRTSATVLTSNDFTSNAVTITQGTASSCPNIFVTLSNIIIAERGKQDFVNSGTLFLEFNDPSFSFKPGTGTVSISPGPPGSATTDISSIGITINASRVTLTYTLDGTNNRVDQITISGLQVNYDGSPPTSTTVIRNGGTANQNGNNGTATHGTANSLALSGVPVVSVTTLNYCQNEVIAPTPIVTSNNTNVQWFRDAALSDEIVAIAGVTAPTAAQLEFLTTLPGTIVRYVTQTPGGQCQSASVAMTLTVQAKPIADLVITSGSSTLCRNFLNGVQVNQSVTFTASPSGAATYDFQVNNVSIQNSALRTFTRNSGNLNNGDQVKVIVTVAGSCPSTSNIVAMTVNSATNAASFVLTNPPPSTLNTLSTFSDQEGPVLLTGTPAGGVFSGNGIVGNSFFPGGVPVGPHTITYQVTTTGCTDTKTRVFDVYSGSSSILGLAPAYCSTSPDFDLTVALHSFTNTELLYVLPLSNYSSNLLPLGSVRAGNNQEVTAANEGNWFLGFVNTSAPMHISPSTITSTGSKVVQFYAVYKSTIDGTISTGIQNVNFFVTPPQPTVSLASGYCLGGPSILTNTVNVTALTGATIRWFTNPSLTTELTAISVKSAPTLLELTISDAAPNTTLRYVTQTLNGCQSAPRVVTINVYAKPSVPGTSTPTAICSGSSFANVSVIGSSVQWYSQLPAVAVNSVNPANPLLVTATELGVPQINLTASPISYTRFVTQTVNGCQSDPVTVTFTVNPIPLAPVIVNPDVSFCQNANITSGPPIPVDPASTNVRWYTPLGVQITPISNPLLATSLELGLNSANVGLTQFRVTQTASGCESPITPASVEILGLTSVSFSVTGGGNISAICKTGTALQLRGSPGGGTWSGTANAALINLNAGAGTADLDPSNANLLPGQTYKLRYTSVGGCATFDEKDVVILPSIAPNVNILSAACNNFFVDLDNTSAIIPNGAPATIVSTLWDFGDLDALPAGSGAIPTGSNGGRTKGSYTQPSHQFKAQGSFQVQYRMITSDGCTIDGSRSVLVSPVPNITFQWGDKDPVCGSDTQFNSNVINGVPISNYNWNFAKLGQLTTSSTGTGQNPVTRYSNTGFDDVELIVTSAANCKDTIQKRVYIVPLAPAIDKDNNYVEDFNSSAGGWIAGGKNSSWQYGKPAATVINRDSSAFGTGSAWKTNLTGKYNAGEQSWVLSPCFDFSSASKPVLTFDIWSDTPRGVDGAVLQVNITDNIENDANWVVLGQVGVGINWYDQNNINSSPGNQTSLDAGWTGDLNSNQKYKSWKRATFALDQFAGESKVKFRIAFASTASSGEGFAFDNIFIGERSRTVLVENFTNSSAKAGLAGSRVQNVAYNTFINGSTELVKVQYHTSFPGDDPINDEFKSIYDARSAFYGLTEAPAARLDGQFRNGAFKDWGNNFYLDRVLDPTPLKIESINAVKDASGVVKINTQLRAQSKIQRGAFVHTLIVEKQITDAKYLGSNGDTEFQFVVKQMLPSPAGYKIQKTLNPGETLNVPEVIWETQKLYTQGTGAIVVFVQQDTLTSKAIYQAEIVLNPPHPDLVTGLGDLLRSDQVTIYPNPADHELTIQLPVTTPTRVQLQMIDQVGRVVNEHFIAEGERSKTISTRDLAGGIYLLQLGSGNTSTRKKILVVHGK
jgi:Secretion system C-terminal sorting domain/Fibronectin type III domain